MKENHDPLQNINAEIKPSSEGIEDKKMSELVMK